MELSEILRTQSGEMYIEKSFLFIYSTNIYCASTMYISLLWENSSEQRDQFPTFMETALYGRGG